MSGQSIFILTVTLLCACIASPLTARTDWSAPQPELLFNATRVPLNGVSQFDFNVPDLCEMYLQIDVAYSGIPYTVSLLREIADSRVFYHEGSTSEVFHFSHLFNSRKYRLVVDVQEVTPMPASMKAFARCGAESIVVLPLDTPVVAAKHTPLLLNFEQDDIVQVTLEAPKRLHHRDSERREHKDHKHKDHKKDRNLPKLWLCDDACDSRVFEDCWCTPVDGQRHGCRKSSFMFEAPRGFYLAFIEGRAAEYTVQAGHPDASPLSDRPRFLLPLMLAPLALILAAGLLIVLVVRRIRNILANRSQYRKVLDSENEGDHIPTSCVIFVSEPPVHAVHLDN